ncbi:MAG: zinc ribbon domain-containing protein [Candidatus Obscuribacterales bacterium]|nr:zinc ribbon domain-containing protein [Candidatus Obscuribacterales bacterium]
MSFNSQTAIRSGVRCAACSSPNDAGARFCGECGVSMHRPQMDTAQSVCNNAPGGAQAPSFARPRTRNTVDPAISRELGSLLVLLMRERIFLIMHWTIFVTLSLIGFGLAMKCYTEFHGDDMSKLMMAITPMLFINLSALVCLTPIKGTKREIERIQEKIAYLKFSVRFKHLL